ncbi:MAG: caspase family protein [Candidatus Aenigmarchaeota archaeon]|nr:caspase family protein [Candidatus Aenigmarchaeota archaeon]
MKHHIVAIGISKHKNPGNNLAYADKDASEFFTLFKQNIGDIGFNRLLIDQEATLSEIKTALGKELRENVKPEDSFFFFYSGHGALINDPNDKNTALGFLVPYDATQDIASTCISIEDLKIIFESLPSKSNLIFIDSCFSGVVIKNGKSYPVPNTKSFKNLKSFTNMVIGNGSITFTASKDDELSIEDHEYKNGLFTHYVLKELQKNRPSATYSAVEIFGPITDGVSKRAKKYKHTQTPTFLGKLEGDLKLPIFKQGIHLKPDTIEIPKTPKLQRVIFSVPDIDITKSEKATLLNDTIDFVINSSETDSSTRLELNFERMCNNLTRKIKLKWEKIFKDIGDNINKIPEAISKMEANSYQFMILGAATTVYGTKKQMQIFSKYLTSLFDLTQGKSGLIALIAVPEVIIVEAVYLIATICIARDTYRPLQDLLETTFDESEYLNNPPVTLLNYNHYHYTRALTGSSNKVNEHVREYLKNQDWLPEFAPTLEEKTDNYQLQANFLFTMLTIHAGGDLWPEYGRYPAGKILPFTKKLTYNKETREQISKIIGVKENEICLLFQKYLVAVRKRGLGGLFWESINEFHLMTDKEKNQI